MKIPQQKWLIGGLALVAIVAGLAVINRPARVADNAVQQLAQASTGKFTAIVQLENAQATQQVLGERGEVELKLDGIFARAEKEGERDRLQADVLLTTKTESVTVTLEGEVRFVNDKAYIYIKKVPVAPKRRTSPKKYP